MTGRPLPRPVGLSVRFCDVFFQDVVAKVCDRLGGMYNDRPFACAKLENHPERMVSG
jgi:hypothetical protein